MASAAHEGGNSAAFTKMIREFHAKKVETAKAELERDLDAAIRAVHDDECQWGDGMREPLGTAASDEWYMGYECFSHDVLCDDETADVALLIQRYGAPGHQAPADAVSLSKAFLPPLHELRAIERHCSATQIEVVRLVVARARQSSQQAYDALLSKVVELGYTEPQLRRTLVYLRDEVPVIIHVGLTQNSRLKKMLDDTHYRSQFEVKMSNGTYESSHASRRAWENRLFGGLYDSVEPFERPKYGVINMCMDPVGIRAAHGYGSSHFITRGVRLRTSFTDRDSSDIDASIACCEHMCHVLVKYTNEELSSVMDVANKLVAFGDSRCINFYKEVQLHGEIKFSENIERIIVDESHRNDSETMKLLDAFVSKNNCTYMFTSDYKAELVEAFDKHKQQLAAATAAAPQ